LYGWGVAYLRLDVLDADGIGEPAIVSDWLPSTTSTLSAYWTAECIDMMYTLSVLLPL
jgi:hypothetical protein